MSLPSLLLPLHIGADGDKRDREEAGGEAGEEPAAARQRVERVLEKELVAGFSDEQLKRASAELELELEHRRAAAAVIRAHLPSFSALSEDELRMVFAVLSAADCSSVLELCKVNKDMRDLCRGDFAQEPGSTPFWQILCEKNGWGPPLRPWPQPWRQEFIRRCTWHLMLTERPRLSTAQYPNYKHLATDGDLVAVCEGKDVGWDATIHTKDLKTQQQTSWKNPIGLTPPQWPRLYPVTALAVDAAARLVYAGFGRTGHAYPYVHMIDIDTGTRVPVYLNTEGNQEVVSMALGDLHGERVLVVGKAGGTGNVRLYSALRTHSRDVAAPVDPDGPVGAGGYLVRDPTRTFTVLRWRSKFSRIDSVVAHEWGVAYCADEHARAEAITWRPGFPHYTDTLATLEISVLAHDGGVLVGAGKIDSSPNRGDGRVNMYVWTREKGRVTWRQTIGTEVPFTYAEQTLRKPTLAVSNGVAVCCHDFEVALMDLRLGSLIRMLYRPDQMQFYGVREKLVAFANGRVVTATERVLTVWA